LLQPFKGKGSLETWASQCAALRDDVIGLAQRRVLPQARAYPFSLLDVQLAQQATGAGTTFLRWRNLDRSSMGVALWEALLANPATPASLIDELYAIELQRIVLNMQISLTHSIARQALECANKAAQAEAACPDLMADGCVGDEQGNLVFLSIWARDTAVQEFLARLTLGRDEQGLDQFHVITEQGASISVFVGNVENLEKRITRAYRRTLFGSLTNVWLFDRRCVKPDKANASALALLPRDSAYRLDRLWTLVQDTCPLPLLDHWRDTVLALLQTRRMLTGLPLALGPLEGHRLALDVPALTKALGELIRNGTLGATQYELAANAPLRRVA